MEAFVVLFQVAYPIETLVALVAPVVTRRAGRPARGRPGRRTHVTGGGARRYSWRVEGGRGP